MLFETFTPDSRVWIYQCNRPFTDAEVSELNSLCRQFADDWVAHSKQLNAAAMVYNKRFILLCVDAGTKASGCSIDKSVHFIKSVEKNYNVFLLNRMLIAYKKGDEILSAPLPALNELYHKGVINDDTLVFDNTITTLDDLRNRWLIPLKNSWIARHLDKVML